MKKINKIKLIKAKNDYLFLLNKNYPEKSTLELVGNRYRLNSSERNILKRGVRKKEQNIKRKIKLKKSDLFFF